MEGMFVSGGRGQEGAAVDVTEYGADPTGVQDCLPAVQAAADALRPGQALFFPPGRYWTSTRTPNDPANLVIIEQSDVTVCGPATLVNLSFLIRGQAGAQVALHPAETGTAAESVRPAAALSASSGDLVQLLSNVNSYASDAGVLRLGGASGATGELYDVRFSEFHVVQRRDDDGTLIFADTLIYPAYNRRVEELRTPMVGIKHSVARRVHAVQGVCFRDLSFVQDGTTAFRTISAKFARDLTVERCSFTADMQPGRHVLTVDCYGVTIRECAGRRRPENARGASWNSFLFGAGSQGITVTDNAVHGDWQAIDLTSFGDFGSLFEADEVSPWRTAQDIVVRGNRFMHCYDSVTTHPGTYQSRIQDNDVRGGSTGIRLRSINNVVGGNRIQTARAGISMSSNISRTWISNNTVVKQSSERFAGRWVGLEYMASGNEVLTENNPQMVRITGNTVWCEAPAERDAALHFYHDARTLQKHPKHARRVEKRRSDIRVERNEFVGGIAVLGPGINGVVLRENGVPDGG